MSKSTIAAKKKKRLVQLRDAQRRRRERLREEKQFFVQIILPEKTLNQLNRMIGETGETMQQAIARLVQSTLPEEATLSEVLPEPEEWKSPESILTPVEKTDSEGDSLADLDDEPIPLEPEPLPLAAAHAEPIEPLEAPTPAESRDRRGQLDLF